jgi:CheY-like chemotaxis protein
MTVSVARDPLHILVADDSRDTVESFSLLLALWGHKVFPAHDGTQALAVAKERRLDLAMLDLAMPGQDGLALAKILRHQVPLVWAVTGYGDPEHQRACEEAGFDAVLLKPVDPVRLRDVLTEAAALVAQSKLLVGRTQELIDQAKRLCADRWKVAIPAKENMAAPL